MTNAPKTLAEILPTLADDVRPAVLHILSHYELSDTLTPFVVIHQIGQQWRRGPRLEILVEGIRQFASEFAQILGVEDLTEAAEESFKAACTPMLLDELAAVLDGGQENVLDGGLIDLREPGPREKWAASHPWRAEIFEGYRDGATCAEGLRTEGAAFARSRRKMELAITRQEEAFFEADRLLAEATLRVGNYDNAVEEILRVLDRNHACARPSEFQVRRWDAAKKRLKALEQALLAVRRRPATEPLATARAGARVRLRCGHGDEAHEALELRALGARGLRLKGAPLHSADGFDTWEVEEIK